MPAKRQQKSQTRLLLFLSLDSFCLYPYIINTEFSSRFPILFRFSSFSIQKLKKYSIWFFGKLQPNLFLNFQDILAQPGKILYNRFYHFGHSYVSFRFRNFQICFPHQIYILSVTIQDGGRSGRKILVKLAYKGIFLPDLTSEESPMLLVRLCRTRRCPS